MISINFDGIGLDAEIVNDLPDSALIPILDVAIKTGKVDRGEHADMDASQLVEHLKAKAAADLATERSQAGVKEYGVKVQQMLYPPVDENGVSDGLSLESYLDAWRGFIDARDAERACLSDKDLPSATYKINVDGLKPLGERGHCASCGSQRSQRCQTP